MFALHEVVMQHPVLELELRRCAALMTKDFVELDLLTSPRLVYVHAPGVIHGREQLTQFLRNEVQFSAVQRRDLQIRALGEMAWITGFLRYEGWRLPARQTFEAFSYVTQIWVQVGQHWQLEVCQSTKVEETMWKTAAGAPLAVGSSIGIAIPDADTSVVPSFGYFGAAQ
ncbi:nuclear transport factor 2 family protein [Paraburkholderia youngii]|nr:nuclear transport factor 2 family protein [Paraburkholderia youngii]